MKYITLALLFLSLSNCNTTNKVKSDEKSAQETVELNGSYLVTHLYGEDVSEHKITMKFDNTNSSVSGYSGCNSYSCKYLLQKESFSFDIPSATKRACPGDFKAEKVFFKALGEISKDDISSNKVVFKNKTGTAVIITKKE